MQERWVFQPSRTQVTAGVVALGASGLVFVIAAVLVGLSAGMSALVYGFGVVGCAGVVASAWMVRERRWPQIEIGATTVRILDRNGSRVIQRGDVVAAWVEDDAVLIKTPAGIERVECATMTAADRLDCVRILSQA